MTQETLNLTAALRDYMLSISLREHDALRRLREETSKSPKADFQIAPEQGQLMALLIEMIGARRVIEVGVFTGYSSLAMALALPEEGRIIACDTSDKYTTVARRYWAEAGVAHKIDLRLAPAIETLDALIEQGDVGSYDFAFIDADKENDDNYYERLLRLVRRGGVIAVDNVLWSGRVIDSRAVDVDTRASVQFNQKLYRDERVSLSVVPIADGLSLAVKR
jgi:predicted O-methyltransferase YrrM